MATFLTTSKMNPALAARVEASVRGHRGRPGASVVRRITSVARFVMVLTVAFGIYTVVAGRRRERRELDRARTELLQAVHEHAAALTADDASIVVRTNLWLTRFSGEYERDLVAPELRVPGAVAASLARPMLYARSPIEGARTAPELADAAASSSKDALVLCLLEPPASRTEKVLLEKVRTAHSGGPAMEARTAHVRRLHDVLVGLPFLLPSWSERVRTAPDEGRVAQLRRELERAPIERAKQAAKSEVLLVALDEPGDGRGPTELDGERPHFVRIELVEIASAKTLFRLRRMVDPAWISTATRSTHASGLDGCALAFDIHEALKK